MTRGDQIPMDFPKRLTLLEAAQKALSYAETLDAIDVGANTPKLTTDLVLIRQAIGEAVEYRCHGCPTHCYDEERERDPNEETGS